MIKMATKEELKEALKEAVQEVKAQNIEAEHATVSCPSCGIKLCKNCGGNMEPAKKEENEEKSIIDEIFEDDEDGDGN